jgi:hypothetical protein
MDSVMHPTNLADFIAAEVQKQSSADAVRELVGKKVAELVKSAIDSAFSWGDTRKQIEKAVTETLAIDRPLDLPTHGAMIMAILRQKIDDQVNGLIASKLSEEMDQILGMAPKEVTLTKLVDMMRESIDEGDRYGTSMTCIIKHSDSSDGYYWVYLDTEQKKSGYDCDLQFAVDKAGKIYSIKCDQKDPKTRIVMGYQEPYQKLALAAYCCGSKFILDEEHPSLGIGDY